MTAWEFLGSAQAPGNGEELSLYRCGDEYSIRVKDRPLMDSAVHGSEDALAELTCEMIAGCPQPRILIGGLGMGYTLAAALRQLNRESQVIVAELVPAVVEWNRQFLGGLTGHPLDDSRVTVRVVDVAEVLGEEQAAYDAILLDVDNGPRGLTRGGNSWLYAQVGLEAAWEALRPRGVLAVWSATTDQAFARRLRDVGFAVVEHSVGARGARGGRQHVVWLAQRCG